MARASARTLAARSAGRPADQRFTPVAGAAAATNIPVPGIKRGDPLLAVLEFIAGVPTNDRVDIASVTSDGNIQIAGQSTAGNQLLVIWQKTRF